MKNQQHLKAGVTTLVQNNWCATYTNTTQLLDESGSETSGESESSGELEGMVEVEDTMSDNYEPDTETTEEVTIDRFYETRRSRKDQRKKAIRHMKYLDVRCESEDLRNLSLPWLKEENNSYTESVNVRLQRLMHEHDLYGGNDVVEDQDFLDKIVNQMVAGTRLENTTNKLPLPQRLKIVLWILERVSYYTRVFEIEGYIEFVDGCQQKTEVFALMWNSRKIYWQRKVHGHSSVSNKRGLEDTLPPAKKQKLVGSTMTTEPSVFKKEKTVKKVKPHELPALNSSITQNKTAVTGGTHSPVGDSITVDRASSTLKCPPKKAPENSKESEPPATSLPQNCITSQPVSEPKSLCTGKKQLDSSHSTSDDEPLMPRILIRAHPQTIDQKLFIHGKRPRPNAKSPRKTTVPPPNLPVAADPPRLAQGKASPMNSATGTLPISLMPPNPPDQRRRMPVADVGFSRTPPYTPPPKKPEIANGIIDTSQCMAIEDRQKGTSSSPAKLGNHSQAPKIASASAAEACPPEKRDDLVRSDPGPHLVRMEKILSRLVEHMEQRFQALENIQFGPNHRHSSRSELFSDDEILEDGGDHV